MFVLASASPRRQELFKLITEDFIVKVADIDEYSNFSDPSDIVQDLALQKANFVSSSQPNSTVIGADTIVTISGKVLGKPTDKQDAKNMLTLLSGKVHTVYTGVAVIFDDNSTTFSVSTDVEFTALSNHEIDDYIAIKEPMDKAGAYGIQGYGSKFIKSIHGDFFSVVGLPVSGLYRTLKRYNLI